MSQYSEKYIKLYDKGTNLLNARKIEDALACFKEALKLEQTDFELFANIGVTYVHLGRNDKALYYLDKSIELNPENITSWLNKGLLYATQLEYDKAIESFQTIIDISPEFSQARMFLSQIKRQKELLDGMQSELKMLSVKAKSLFFKGLKLMHKAKLNESNNFIQRSLDLEPNFSGGWTYLGINNYTLGNVRESLKYFDKALKIKPDNYNAWTSKGASLDKLTRYDDAIECFDKAIEINPNRSSAWNNKGLSLDIMNRHEEAIKCYNKSIKLNPDLEFAWMNKAESLVKLGRNEEAIECYKEALKLNPRQDRAQEMVDRLKVHIAYRDAGKTGPIKTIVDGRVYCPRCRKKNYSNSPVCQYCGQPMGAMDIQKMMQTAIELENIGKFEQAINAFDYVLNVNPANAEACFFKGKALVAIGDFEHALIFLSKAKEFGVGGMSIMMYSMIAFANMKNFKKPNLSPNHLKSVELKVPVYFPDAKVWGQSGAAYQMLGQYEKAYKSYLKALEFDPNYDSALKNKERIESISLPAKSKKNYTLEQDFREKLYDYLRKNQGNAFTMKALENRLETFIKDSNLLQYGKKNLQKVLDKMKSTGQIHSQQHEGKTHYFIS